jgi:hypothetical protein
MNDVYFDVYIKKTQRLLFFLHNPEGLALQNG